MEGLDRVHKHRALNQFAASQLRELFIEISWHLRVSRTETLIPLFNGLEMDPLFRFLPLFDWSVTRHDMH